MSGKHANRAKGDKRGAADQVIDEPSVSDGAEIWRIARDSGKLDLNSSYAYLMWCHDFADTSAVARVDNEVVGFVIGYRRPARPDTVVVWQIAVDASQRGRGTAGALLDSLMERLVEQGVRHMETTITPDNAASNALFAALAKRWDTTMAEAGTFDAGDFPDEHESEIRFRIGPFAAPGVRAAS
ncbi:diaminobutyrate acetyltransferase [Actinophytocola gossypii]|uniref:L-2,4-diaminobutyric acid acetyltransferase n=1 Tax=Actinophytocola gossypii TaxID=2812003 RepID=A0ABT2J411_9PSEU|nr:diaminobutyrate acetyltransferase [Actinophytocola gossypii]MCT2582614.1 diaminobutyrate acetyltransferase [Actinophytocola gossypii]